MLFLFQKNQPLQRTELVGEYTSFKNNADNILLTCSGGCIPPHLSEPIHFQCQFCCLPSIRAQCRESACILNFSEKSSCLALSEIVQFTTQSQQRTKTTKMWEGKVGGNRLCEMPCYPLGSLCYTLTCKHVHIIHQSLMLKCIRDERRALNNRPTEWGSGYLHSVHSRSTHKNSTKQIWRNQHSIK